MARTLPTPAVVPRPAQFADRQPELDLVSRAIDHSRVQGSLVVFEGASGIGRSRLLAELGKAAQGHGACALRARGGELEVDFDLGVALQLFEPRLSAVDPLERGELMAAAGAAAPLVSGGHLDGTSRDAVLHGLWRLVRNLAEHQPVLITVDDLQWVDRASLEFLVYVSQRLDDLPLVVACTRTTGEDGPHPDLVDRLQGGPFARMVTLGPLSVAGVATIAGGEGFAAAPRDFLESALQASGGVPFLVKALLASARSAGLTVDTDPDRLATLASEPVWRAITLRLERLPEGARALARATAILGLEATIARAALVAGLDHFTAMEAVETLRRAQLLDEGASELRFRHSVVRESLYEGLPATSRALGHLQAARVLWNEDAPPEHVAAHLLGSHQVGEPWALAALRQAGRAAAAAGALSTAVAYLRRALEEDPEGDERTDLLAELGEAEVAKGDPAGAARLSSAANASNPGPARAQTLERLGGALWLSGRDAEAAEAFERALADTGDGSDAQSARLRAGLLMAGRLRDGLRERTARRLGPELREPNFGRPREPALLASVAFVRALAGRRSTRVVELADRALEGGGLIAADVPPGAECFAACCALLWSDSLSTAEIALTMALEGAHRRGHAGAVGAASRFRAWTVFQRGRLAHAAADALAAGAGDGDLPTAAVPRAATILAEIDMEQGRIDEAGLLLEDAAHRTTWDDGPQHAFHLSALGRLRHRRGDHAGALEDLLEAGRRMESLDVHNPAVLPWRSRAAVAAMAAHDRARAATLAAEEVALARTFGASRPLGVALRAAALVAPAEERLVLLQEAVACLERSPGALDRSRALIDLGSELRRVGRRRDSRDCLRAGLDVAHRCEATMLVARAHEELVASGARPRRERLSGSDALTPRERQVAELAARGVSNRDIAQRLFITPKTVEWHLGNAYRKLELHSRSSLIGALSGNEDDQLQ